MLASNVRGSVSFAQTGERDSRSTQLFVNLADNTALDAQRFVPVGEVIKGMEVVDLLYSGYGELDGFPQGQFEEPGDGPNQERIERQGNAYLEDRWPLLSYISAVCDGAGPCGGGGGGGGGVLPPRPASSPIMGGGGSEGGGEGGREGLVSSRPSEDGLSRPSETLWTEETVGVSAAGGLLVIGAALAFVIGRRTNAKTSERLCHPAESHTTGVASR